MNDRNRIAGGLLARIAGKLRQTSGRSYRREAGSAFERSMEARMKAEAYYAMPVSHI